MLHPVKALRKTAASLGHMIRDLLDQQTALRQEYESLKMKVATLTPGNPALFGHKVYSQFDEDGITAHVFSKLGDGEKVFVEIGCSNGLENNTHSLLLQGWRGLWIDADMEKLNFISKHVPQSSTLLVRHAFVSVENVNNLVAEAATTLRATTIDFLSIDIDGDDLNVLSELLNDFKPRLICAEYNAKFPPPMKVQIRAKNKTFWIGDDYHGASLSSIVEALEKHGYVLITCGLSGVNAFFVRSSDASQFPMFTVGQLYQPARFSLRRFSSGHPPSLEFLADKMAK